MIPRVFNGSHWEVVWPECCGKEVVVNRLRDEVDLEKAAGSALEGRRLFNGCAWSRSVHIHALGLVIGYSYNLSILIDLSLSKNWFTQLWQHRHSILRMLSTDTEVP